MKNELGTWYSILKDEIEKPYFKYIINRINDVKENLCPNRNNVFKAFRKCDYSSTRLVIIAQDPYYNEGVANGLAFSTDQEKAPPSLKNIFKEIKTSIGEDNFNSNDLTSWTNQGVLLLNAALTTELGVAKAHSKLGWDLFTKRVLQELNNHPNDIVFMLWGNDAKKLKQYIINDRHLILEAAHPSPLSASRGFFGCNHFKLANDFIKEKYNIIINYST